MIRGLIAALAGALTWSLVEYGVHRFLGHLPRLRPNPFATEHVRHHVEGNYFAPSWKKATLALAVTVSLLAPAVRCAGLLAGAACVAGFVGFYGLYEVLHRREHTRAGRGPYARWARRHHFTHHFIDARCNHGVTSPLWDLVFGTYRSPARMTVPRKLCMPWLTDPETDAVRADWSRWFVLAPTRESGASAPRVAKDQRDDSSDSGCSAV